MKLHLPHWASVGVAIALLFVTWLVRAQTSGNVTLPAAVMSVLVIAQGVLGLLQPSVSAKVNAKAVARAATIVGGHEP